MNMLGLEFLWAAFGYLILVGVLGWLTNALGKQKHRRVVNGSLGFYFILLMMLVSWFLNGKAAVEAVREINPSVNVLFETAKRLQHINFTMYGLFPVKPTMLIPDMVLWFLILAPFILYITNIVVLFLPRKGENRSPGWWEGAWVEIIVFVVILAIWSIGLITIHMLK